MSNSEISKQNEINNSTSY